MHLSMSGIYAVEFWVCILLQLFKGSKQEVMLEDNSLLISKKLLRNIVPKNTEILFE